MSFRGYVLGFSSKFVPYAGNYNPDWAVVKQNVEKAYFVAETKNTGQGIQNGVDESRLREDEQLKIQCARACFEKVQEVEYRVAEKLEEL